MTLFEIKFYCHAVAALIEKSIAPLMEEKTRLENLIEEYQERMEQIEDELGPYMECKDRLEHCSISMNPHVTTPVIRLSETSKQYRERLIREKQFNRILGGYLLSAFRIFGPIE